MAAARTSPLPRRQPRSRPMPVPATSAGWLPPPCSVCGDDTEVDHLPEDEGFSPDERICLRCGRALLLGPLVAAVAAPLLVGQPARQPRSA
jgi:hypothetical protein